MLVVNRFEVDDEPAFVARAKAALAVLAARPGYRSGRFGRAVDDPRYWCLVTDWESVGVYRRALSAFDVKVSATPLLAESIDEPSAYEVLLSAAPDSDVQIKRSDRATGGTDGPLRSHP